ncbi:type II toxin-antitoxin system RelE/ParE family toxin [uncultured Caulobacter sp.]|uniref:type II toxin-antitoxin system RelE/ParE family toxin n=1 Tax=uncultured Caulobacter sp. TaxID=158749 RepID=UPI002637F0D2|nr:type II toxin-antitoxin system RelE/ParE family toxin [uncultured Caulobacter sp.]
MRRIVIAGPVWADLERLQDWLADRDAPYAEALGATLRAAILGLRRFPERGRLSAISEMRELVVPFRTWTYVISYRVRPDRVTIARIHHSLEDR